MRMTLNKPRESCESARTRLLAAAMAIRASCRHGKTCKDCPFYGGESVCKLGTSTPQEWQIECEV